MNALFNSNKLKLGVFGTNCSSGCTATTAEGTLETTWPKTLEVAQLADQAGMEAMVPIARWKAAPALDRACALPDKDGRGACVRDPC